MKWFRKTYWYVTAFAQKHWKLMLVVLGASIVFSYLFLSFLLSPARLKKTAYVGRVGTISLATLPRDIQEKISVGLTIVDDDGTVRSGLAKSWGVEDGGKTYHFMLDKGLKWQDGQALKPRDIPYNFTETSVVTSDSEIIFKLKEPFAPFLSVVSQPIFREDKQRIVGAGEYRVRDVRREGSNIKVLDLESLDDVLTYRFYPTEDAAFTALKSGEVDVLEDMTTDGGLSTWKTITVQPQVRQDRYLAVFFNFDDPGIDKAIRQALNYAIQKPRGDIRARSPIRSSSWAYNKTVKSYDFDLSNAVELLLRDQPKAPISIKLATVPAFRSEAEEILKDWQTLGFAAFQACQGNTSIKDKSWCPNLRLNVSLQVTNVPDTNNFQALLIGQQIPVDPDQYFLWHSTQSTNFTHYKSPRVDKLLELGRKTISQEDRKLLYEDFQQYLTEDSIAIFLKHPTTYRLQRKPLF